MGSPLAICHRRGVVAVLASGVVISLTALTGGVAPAFAKPDDEQPVVPTTPFELPEPEYSMPEPEEVAPAPKEEAPAPAPERPVAPQPTRAVEIPQAPAVEAPPPTQEPEVVEPQPQTQAPQPPATPTRPPVTSVEPAAPEPVEEPEPVEQPAPQSEEPAPVETPADEPASAEAPAPRSEEPAPRSDEPAPKSDEPEPTTAGSEPTLVSPTEALAPESEDAPAADAPATPDAERSAAPTAESSESETTASEAAEAAEDANSSSTEPATSEVSQAARVIETAQPQTLEAENEDVEQAKAAEPVEEKVPVPAAEKDVANFTNAINLSLGRDGVNAGANTEFRLGGDRDRDWDWARKVRQWRPDWVEYDQFYRPIIMNPFRAPVRIVYVYDFAPRILYIPPLARIVLDVARYAAYSFTAAILSPINAAIDTVQAVANIAVGSFFGGGYVPRVGLPLPAPPPPVLRYDNVPVLVRYSQQTYEPFRVRRIVDVGDDRQYGGRKVLLDGVTPAWGQWTQTASGERQFEVHKTQQFPGLDTPREGPLPGDYPLRLASDESSTAGLTGRDVFLYVAAGVVGTLGFGAIAMAFYLGRRRPEH